MHHRVDCKVQDQVWYQVRDQVARDMWWITWSRMGLKQLEDQIHEDEELV